MLMLQSEVKTFHVLNDTGGCYRDLSERLASIFASQITPVFSGRNWQIVKFMSVEFKRYGLYGPRKSEEMEAPD